MTEEVVVPRGEGEEPGKDQEAQLDAELEGLFEKAKAAPAAPEIAAPPRLEIAGPPRFWDVFALGPYQVPALKPSRVIDVGEWATILTVVYLNPTVPSPYPGQNACDIITGFGAKIELNYITSNMQTMQPVPALSATYCIQTTPGQCWYRHYWRFRPQERACKYHTNICCRICNCDNYYVRQYSGFARWIANLDFDLIFGAPAWTFDHPVRFMVSDPKERCNCP